MGAMDALAIVVQHNEIKEMSRLKRILIKSEMAELPDDLIQDKSTILNVTSNQLNELQTVFNDPVNFYYIVDHFGI